MVQIHDYSARVDCIHWLCNHISQQKLLLGMTFVTLLA